MRNHPLLTAGTVAALAGVGFLAYLVAGADDSDLGLAGMLMFSGVLAFAVFTLVLVVLWLVEVLSRSRDDT